MTTDSSSHFDTAFKNYNICYRCFLDHFVCQCGAKNCEFYYRSMNIESLNIENISRIKCINCLAQDVKNDYIKHVEDIDKDKFNVIVDEDRIKIPKFIKYKSSIYSYGYKKDRRFYGNDFAKFEPFTVDFDKYQYIFAKNLTELSYILFFYKRNTMF